MNNLTILFFIGWVFTNCASKNSDVKGTTVDTGYKTACEKVLRCDKKWQSITEKGCVQDLEELGFRDKIISCIENTSCENLDTKLCVSNSVK
ncbi:MAG: hypothetical protein L6Q54_10640 [Leptospiraceae bacterium]|nr:hypothetical protein [Leptospiraceae bacterium]MCK6381685.1 hypothetical protein [Leptospiraceae bacterium]NUM40552.1 hypothetical protein [Leptospiraceae bacterium]